MVTCAYCTMWIMVFNVQTSVQATSVVISITNCALTFVRELTHDFCVACDKT